MTGDFDKELAFRQPANFSSMEPIANLSKFLFFKINDLLKIFRFSKALDLTLFYQLKIVIENIISCNVFVFYMLYVLLENLVDCLAAVREN